MLSLQQKATVAAYKNKKSSLKLLFGSCWSGSRQHFLTTGMDQNSLPHCMGLPSRRGASVCHFDLWLSLSWCSYQNFRLVYFLNIYSKESMNNQLCLLSGLCQKRFQYSRIKEIGISWTKMTYIRLIRQYLINFHYIPLM